MPGIARDARKAARSPRMQPRQPDEIQPRLRRDAANMRGIAASVENGRIDPAEIRPEADAPYDRRNAAVRQVERRALAFGLPHGFITRTGRRVDAMLLDEAVDARVDPVIRVVGAVERFDQIRRELQAAVAQIVEPAIEFHAFERKAPKIDIPPAVAARDI